MQKLQLSIPEPCHENWQEMSPTQQGRFCNACAKEVIDFSTMMDIQVLNYFSTLTHQKVCGRALPEQLNRTISRPDTPKKRLFWYWNYIVMFFMFIGQGNVAKAQGAIQSALEVSYSKNLDTRGLIVIEGKVVPDKSRVITGNITDMDGNPIPFASVKIKGNGRASAADAKGEYSIRINKGAILEILCYGFKPKEIITGDQIRFSTVMEIDNNPLLGEVTTTANCFGAKPREIANTALIKVRDEQTNTAVNSATIIRHFGSSVHSSKTDRKGTYTLWGIKNQEQYYIKIIAEGYEPYEFTIESADFKDNKKEWEVLLRKQKVETVIAKPVTETRIRMGGVSSINIGSNPLYVVDGIIMPSGTDVNPDDIENTSILQSVEAMALFGPEGANGAIVITTRKTKEKTLDTLSISAGPHWICRKITCCTTTTLIKENNGLLNEKNIEESAFLIYPNPVQRGAQFNLSLKLEETGQHQILITDALGRIVLQKQVHAVLKELTEKITADARWSSGTYYISVFDTKNKLINKNGFIVR